MPVFSIEVNNEVIYRSDRVVSLTSRGDSVISPKLKKETNKADSLEFTILPSNEAYDSFKKKSTFVFMKRDNKYIFRGRVSDIKTDIFKQRTITCEGDLSFLADSVQPPNKKTNTEKAGSTNKWVRTVHFSRADGGTSMSSDTIKMKVSDYFRSLINEHNVQVQGYGKGFTVGDITISDANNVETFERTSFQDTSSIISSDLLSVYGGVLRTRFENNEAYIDWLDDYTDTSTQNIRFGINLLELDQEAPSDDPWSVLLPVGDDNITIADVNSGSKYLVSDTALDKYGYIVHYHKFENVKKAPDLLTKARRYLRTHGKVFPDNLVIKAIDLHLLGESDGPLELGEKIKVISSPHGLSKTMSCISMELDIHNPENNSYTIGVIMPPDKEKKKESLSEKLRDSDRSSSRASGRNSNAINSLKGDVDANSNNINVNSENIAVNALNIAVNAENIAVVAKNIAIAADTIDIKAQEITAELEDVENNMSTKIQVTAEGITTEFNKTIYGENQDGNGGIVADYKAKIQASAESLTSSYTKLVNDTKTDITTEYTSKITQTADSINTEVRKKVGKSEVVSSINQTAETIKIQASRIDLSGYVTATQLATTNANITNLTNGSTIATKIVATSGKVTTGTFDIGDSNNNAKLNYRGTEYYSLTVSMPGVAGSFEALGYYYYDREYKSGISLAHSHSVSTGTDGTITIGGSVATNATNRSFKIADTKAYKDGVSAAIASVTISSVDKNPDSNVTYNTSSNQYSIPLLAVASNSNSKTNAYTFYATESYSAGNTKGKSDAVSAFKNQLSVSCEAAQSDNNDGIYDAAQIKVSFYNASSSKWDSKTIDNVPMYKVYNKGYSAGYDAGLDTAVSEVKNHMSVECVSAQSDDNDGIYDAAKIKVTFYNASSSGWDSKTFNNVAMWRVYNEGRDDCHRSIEVTAVQVFANGSASVTIKTTGGQTTKSVAASKVTDNHT